MVGLLTSPVVTVEWYWLGALCIRRAPGGVARRSVGFVRDPAPIDSDRALVASACVARVAIAAVVASRDMASWRESDRIAATIVARQPENFREDVYPAELARDRRDMLGAVRHYRDAIA